MSTLNIEALQKTQASIADPAHPFNMCYWGRCIYAHANHANDWIHACPTETAQRLGVDLAFFSIGIIEGSATDRDAAIARIQALIDAAQPAPQPEPEPELVYA